jgi:hypothetical protein
VSTIFFRPVGSRVLFDLEKPDGILFQCSIKNLSLLGSGSAQKIAVRATDTSELAIDTLTTRLWSGGGSDTPSIGLQLRGREMLTVSRATLFADRPISIEANPRSTISLDHAHFRDLYLGVLAPDESSIQIAPGVNLTNIVIDGTNAFVLGKGGITWVDAVGPTSSMNLRFSNIRCEQSKRPGGYAIGLSHYIQNLLIENVHADIESNGFRLHGVRCATLTNCVYSGRGIALDIDSVHNYDVVLLNCFFQAGSIVRAAGMREAMTLHKSVAGSPVAPIAFFDHGSNPSRFVVRDGVRQYSRTGMLAVGESIAIPFPTGGRNVGIVTVAARDAGGSPYLGSWALTEEAIAVAHGAPVLPLPLVAVELTSAGMARVRNLAKGSVSYVLTIDWGATPAGAP